MGHKTSELRIRVPIELKNQLKDLAKAKNTTMNNLGILLVNQLINRKPNLLASLSSLVNVSQLDKEIMPSYSKLISAYSLLIAESPENTTAFMSKSDNFIRRSQDFIQQLLSKSIKEKEK